MQQICQLNRFAQLFNCILDFVIKKWNSEKQLLGRIVARAPVVITTHTNKTKCRYISHQHLIHLRPTTLLRLNFVRTPITWRLMYHKLSRSTGQRSRTQRDITYQHHQRHNSGTDKLSKVELGENYARAESNTKHMFKIIIGIAITPPRVARLRSNLYRDFITT